MATCCWPSTATRDLPHEEIIERIRASADTPLDAARSSAPEQPRDVTVVPRGPQGAALIGVGISQYEVRRIDPSVVEAVKLSVQQNWETTRLIGKTLGGLAHARDTGASVDGTGRHRSALRQRCRTGLGALLLNLMAMISLNLGLLNLMPVPVLDGGHIAILAVEGLARRDLSVRVKERILVAGATVMVLLMVTVIYNDIARLMR